MSAFKSPAATLVPTSAAPFFVAGQYCDGQTSVAHPVDIRFSDCELVVSGSNILRRAQIAEVRVSDALGKLPRTITFKDGATLVVPSSDALSRQLAEPSPTLQRWESKYRYAIAALAATLGLVWGLYFYAIPFIADEVVARLGSFEFSQTGSSLEKLDDVGYWGPSQLDSNQQSQMRLMIAEGLRAGHTDPQQIAFRNSPVMGANAVALESGDIVLTDDLVHILNTQEQIAVAAHELGHVHHHHVQRLWLRQVGLIGAIRLLVGGNGLQGPVADTTQLLGQTHYSREFEAEADAYAVNLLTASGIAPCNLASALRKLEAVVPEKGRVRSDWFSSHPLTENRIAMIGGSCGP